MSRVEIRLTDHALELASPMPLEVRGGLRVVAPRVALDTGQDFDLCAPLHEVRSLIRDGEASTQRIRGHGGHTTATVFEATIRLGDRAWRIEVWAYDGAHWLLGLPVLREYDILMVPDADGASWLSKPR